jgi:hypothetical protein
MGVLDQVCFPCLHREKGDIMADRVFPSGPIGGVSLLGFLLAWPNKKYLPALERRAWKDVDFVGGFLL